jgi:hypothetical protein
MISLSSNSLEKRIKVYTYAMKHCSKDCQKPIYGLGLCRNHYQQMRRRRVALTGRKCGVEGCGRPHEAKGYCPAHYEQQRRGEPIREAKQRIIHGLSRHSSTQHYLYSTWEGMRLRCNNPNFKQYKDYGGRGIKVCKRWNDFRLFLADMGERPEGYTIDRINNDGNYEPSNCRWASWCEQATHNSRSNDIPGIAYRKQDNLWNATLMVRGEKKLNQSFKNKTDAVKARKQAEKQFL